MNVYLVGLRGSGKSTVGKMLSARTGWEFTDQDALVEQRAGCSIAEIFATDGEGEFRRIESEVLSELASRSGLVVATGGGVVLAEENRMLMSESGIVVHLDGTPETLTKRIQADASSESTRPALTSAGDALAEMKEVARKRAPLYEAASDVTVSAEDAPEKMVEHIMAFLAERGISTSG